MIKKLHLITSELKNIIYAKGVIFIIFDFFRNLLAECEKNN
jgi:hypothetical protein